MPQTSRLAVLCFATLLWGSNAYAQRIENFVAAFTDGKVILTYDLAGTRTDQKFQIEVFSSHNNFSAPLRSVTGDVGAGVSGGNGKRIEWHITTELGNFKGQLSFRLRGSETVPNLTLTSPAGGKLKSGKPTTVQWTGGYPGQQMKLSLLQNGREVQTIATVNNSGNYQWVVPPETPKGEYQIQIIGGTQTAKSQNFIIGKKMPLWLMLSPLAVGAVVAIILSGGDGGDDPPKTGDSKELPVAPGPQ